MSKSTNVLVIGGNGYIGTWLRSFVDSNYYFSASRLGTDKLHDEIESNNPSAVLILGGITRFDVINNNYQRAWDVNVNQTIRTFRFCIKHDMHIVYTSSESVFDGKKGYYQESSCPRPIFKYGEMKKICEDYLLSNCINYAIVRLAKVYSKVFDNTLLSGIIHQASIANNNNIYTSDSKFSPVGVEYVCKALNLISSQEQSGIFHLSGVESYSRSDIAELYNCLKPKKSPYLLFSTCKHSQLENISYQPRMTNLLSYATRRRLDLAPSVLSDDFASLLHEQD